MIRNFFDRGTEDIYNGIDSKVARKTLPSDLWAVAIRELDQLNAAIKREALRKPPGNRLEALAARSQRAARDSRQRSISRVLCVDDRGTHPRRNDRLPLSDDMKRGRNQSA